MQSSAFFTQLGTTNNHFRDNHQVPQFQQIAGDTKIAIIFTDFSFKQLHTVHGAIKALIGADNAHIIPH